MARNKVVFANGIRYTLRNLTFKELVNLGEKDLTDKDIRDVGNEVVSKCIVSPQLRKTDVARLDQQTVIQLATECLNLIRENDKTSGLAFGSVSGMSELDGNEGNN